MWFVFCYGKKTKQSLFLISLCFYVLFVVFRLVLQGCGFYYSAIMTPRSQIKFCLLQVYVYKLALSQHIFLEDMEKWNGRSSLSIVESFLCCAVRYGNCWERFRTPRRHVNEYFYTDNKTRLQHSRSWSPQQSHWQLSGFSLECQLLLRRIIRMTRLRCVEKTVETASHCGDNKRVAHCCLE